jgi:hypothetical protein
MANVNIDGNWYEASGTGTPTDPFRLVATAAVTGMPASVGQKAMAASLPVTIASDQSAVNTELPLVIVGAHVQNTDLDVVVEITVPAGARQWLVQCQTKDVRFTLDGSTAATAAVGFLLKADAPPVIVPCYRGGSVG